nr:retrovirus-related Pol polyprotein from transposon TNT 1-94 [Tanacetum cinerariifolium]
MYNVDLKNVAPLGGLTCYFAKDTVDESNLWHRRLRHINFKTVNKLAAGTMLADSKLPTTFWAEAVNTACYVQNRVLVVKPHNKTPYELFHGRTPSLSFMRPFGCPVTILNTLDPLGKFDGKADEGFFVGYFVNSNAFRVFNRNQSNGSAGKARGETVHDKDYILLPLWTQDLLISSSSKDSPGDGFKPSGEEEKKDVEDPRNEDNKVLSTKESRVNQEKDVNVNNTNNINIISPTANAASIKDNAVDENIVYRCADDLNMHNMEDIVYSNEDKDVGTKAGMTNLDTNILSVLFQQPEFIRIIQVTLKKREYIMMRFFALVARIEAIRLFLAYASFKDFVVYQMDVKSAFLYGKIKEEIYVCQSLGFEDPEFPDRVYNVEKTLYGLHQALRAWCENLSTYLLDNGFHRGQIDKTLFIKRIKIIIKDFYKI